MGTPFSYFFGWLSIKWVEIHYDGRNASCYPVQINIQQMFETTNVNKTEVVALNAKILAD
jgi:hypothetical protein